jgi:hippurate hydrolase
MTTVGPFMAGADHFDLKIYGKSGHAARPEDCVDPIVLVSQLVAMAQSIVSRQVRPTDPAVLSFTKILSGDSYNVIPEFAELWGTFRTMNPELSDLVENSLTQLAKSLAENAGGHAELDYRRVCPVLINTLGATEVAKGAVLNVLDNGDIIEPSSPIMGTEDFAYMSQDRNGCLIRLGSRPGENPVPGLHNAYYDFNDDLLPIGASIWVRIANEIFGIQN